jgi:hypothetical protein
LNLNLTAARHRLRLTLRVPPGRKITPRLQAKLRGAPAGVTASLRSTRQGTQFTLVAGIPEQA